MLRNVSTALALLALPFAVGCAAEERNAEDVGTTEQAITTQTLPNVTHIVDGVNVNGTTSFVLDRGSRFPIIFQVTGGVTTSLANGFEVQGDVQLLTPVGSLDLANADIKLTMSDGHRIDAVSGTVSLAAPSIGALSNLTMNAPLSATIGYDLGKNLKSEGVSAPILDDRKYIAFTYSAGVSMQLGQATMNVGSGKGGTFVVDPSDPSFFTTGNLFGLDGVKQLNSLAFGMSARGLLQFTPEQTWGIEGDQTFTGHLYSTGTVSLERIPLSFQGEAVFNLDPTHTGQVIGTNMPNGFEAGFNGSTHFSLDVKAVHFDFPIAEATMVAKATPQHQTAWLSAHLGTDTTWMPNVLPLIPSPQADFAAYLDSNADKSFVKAQTDFSLDANKFYEMIPQLKGIDLSDITIAHGSFVANKDGVTATGTFTTPKAGFIQAGANAMATATFPTGDRSAAQVHVDGDIVVGGVTLASASAQIDKSGFAVNGNLSTLNMAGKITSTGATFDGSVKLPLRGASMILTDAADATYCGYTYADDISTCGANDIVTVSETFARDFQQVTDGAKCGFEDAGDDILCGISFGTDCKKPKTCTVSMATCTQAVAKCRLPASCPHLTADTSFDFGMLVGTVHVAIVNGTATGSVSGQICDDNGNNCVALPSASVTLGATPKVCVSGLKGATGDVCATF